MDMVFLGYFYFQPKNDYFVGIEQCK